MNQVYDYDYSEATVVFSIVTIVIVAVGVVIRIFKITCSNLVTIVGNSNSTHCDKEFLIQKYTHCSVEEILIK